MAFTLKNLQDKGITHRDLKPENFVLDENYDLKFIDFGSAKNIEKEREKLAIIDSLPMPSEECSAEEYKPGSSRMKTDTFVGTFNYISPETFGKSRCHPTTDLWAFGCIIFKMLTGKAPF
jgi:serine/threonine protein kinase